MKTSKIIFISLLSVIALIILASLIDLRITGRRDSKADFKTNKQIIPSFRVLSLNNSNNVQLVQNDSSYIEVTYLKDSVAPDVKYVIKSDTLFISDLKKLNRSNISIKINSTDSLRKVQMSKSDFGIEDFNFSQLSFDLDQSELWLNQPDKKKTAVRFMDIVVRNHSHINCNGFNADSISVILHNSEADFDMDINKIGGSLSDSSRIYIRSVGEIALKKDATSKININD